MAADFTVHLMPTSEEETQTPIVFKNVVMGFNQLGWLAFDDGDTRQCVAAFTPGSVRYVVADRETVETKGSVLSLVN